MSDSTGVSSIREIEVSLETALGPMKTYIKTPEGAGQWPVVVFYMDAMGIREELHRMARNIAGQGFVVVIPDLYHRLGVFRPNLGVRDKQAGVAVTEQVMAAIKSLTIDHVLEDTRVVLDFTDSQGYCQKGPMGCIGFCMSGAFALCAAGTFPERFRATASLYGTSMVTESASSPHLVARSIQGALYLGFAENDPHVEDNVPGDLYASLGQAGVDYESKVFPDTEHGFCFADRKKTYKESAADQVWHDVFAMFNAKLT